MAQQHALDPSHSVPQDLMSHVHLVSSFRYPNVSRLDLNEVAKWLMSAPQIARQQSPVFWTYLDKPPDGTVLLTWQPLQRLNVTFATDGYIWAPPEQVYKHDLGNGLILEVYWSKAGLIPGEQACTHARRRFRLVPAPNYPNPPQIDVSLFIVHYGPAEPNDRIPAHLIQHDQGMNQLLQQRHYFTRAGQIRRKEFMLSDRVNWPSLPDLARQQMGPQMTPRGVPQQMAYPTQPTPGPPAKRARHSQPQGPPGAMPAMPLEAFDDEEDGQRGDFLDHVTPREISLARYQQNHEWMEEILSSPYRLNQITPSDLGLGLRGELASLTEGIFAAHSAGAFELDSHVPEKAYVGRLDAGLADKFRKRVQDHIETTKSEIEKMQAEHAEALAEFKKTSILGTKEKELRTLVEGSGQEIWRVEGEGQSETIATDVTTNKKSVADIVTQVQEATGRKIETKPPVKRVQEGGYQAPVPEPEPEPEAQPPAQAIVPSSGLEMSADAMSRQPSQAPSQASGLMLGDSDLDMGGTAAGLLDQMHGTGFSATSTPGPGFATPQAQLSANQSNAATPNANAPSPAPQAAPAAASAATAAPSAADVDMSGTEAAAKQPSTTPDQGTGSGDWVVVPKEGATPGSTAGAPTGAPSGEGSKSATPAAAAAPAAGESKPTSVAATPAGYDQNDFSSLGDLDTAGDALASFDTPQLDGAAGELGDDLDFKMDMEDSAFGDAYHGAGESGTTPGQEL